MTLWTMKPGQDHDVYTVVYLLKDALRSALSDAWYFERTALPKTDLKGAGHAEIAAKLGRFRDSCKGFEEREALMVTKLLRARNWAAELRRLEPEFQPDIDIFLDATALCEEIQPGSCGTRSACSTAACRLSGSSRRGSRSLAPQGR